MWPHPDNYGPRVNYVIIIRGEPPVITHYIDLLIMSLILSVDMIRTNLFWHRCMAINFEYFFARLMGALAMQIILTSKLGYEKIMKKCLVEKETTNSRH